MFVKLNMPSKFYPKQQHRQQVTNIFWETFSPPFTTLGTSQYSGEGVELMAVRGESLQLGAHKASTRYIIQQSLTIRYFFTNRLFSNFFCSAAWMENLNTSWKYIFPAVIPFKTWRCSTVSVCSIFSWNWIFDLDNIGNNVRIINGKACYFPERSLKLCNLIPSWSLTSTTHCE